MKKIIVKVKLKNREQFEKKMTDIEMQFSDVIWQHDRVFLPKNFKPNVNLPRLILRTEMKVVDKPAKYMLILKRHIEDSGVDIVDETIVKDYSETANMIQQLGFKMRRELSKKRREVEIGDGAKMYLDKVEGIAGYYAKLESTFSEKDSVEEVYNDLVKTFAVLGEKDIAEKAYFEFE